MLRFYKLKNIDNFYMKHAKKFVINFSMTVQYGDSHACTFNYFTYNEGASALVCTPNKCQREYTTAVSRCVTADPIFTTVLSVKSLPC